MVTSEEAENIGKKVKIYSVEERETILGFKPQSEIVYNNLLPYLNRLDVESNKQFAEIKSQIGRAILLRDVKVAGLHWIGQLSKYVRLYGMKFSFEDHIQLIKLLFEVICIPDLQYSLIQKYAITLTTLLKKSELIPRKSLVLPWQPLFRLFEDVENSRYEHHGMVCFPDNIEITLRNLIQACRVYFSTESTQQMLNQWRPLMCPFDSKMGSAMLYFEYFLPTMVYPEEHKKTFQLWFGELLAIYCSTVSGPSWEQNLVNLFARLAHDCSGYVDWEQYLEQIFTRFLREFDLPVGSKKLEVKRFSENIEANVAAKWIIFMISKKNNVLNYTSKMFKALESFYHPSNNGKWSNKLLKFLSRLSIELVKRLEREKWTSSKEMVSGKSDGYDEAVKAMKSKDWKPEIPEDSKLTEEDLTHLIKCMGPALMSAMFSKSGSTEAATTFKNLSFIRPEIVIPPLLEWTYSALETLT